MNVVVLLNVLAAGLNLYIALDPDTERPGSYWGLATVCAACAVISWGVL